MAKKTDQYDPLPDSFLELPDVPNSYAGQAGKVLVVNAAGDALEFTDRIIVSSVSPHLTLTSNVKVMGNLGVAGVAPSVYSGITIQPVPTPELNIWTGLAGNPTVNIPSGSATGYIKGLYFSCGIGRGGNGAILPILAAIEARIATIAYTGAITLGQGLRVGQPFLFMGTPSITTWEAIVIDACARSQIVDAYGVHIGDITANSGFTRLLEIGPSTPYMRLLGGGDPPADKSNLILKFGDTLYRVVKTGSAMTLEAV